MADRDRLLLVAKKKLAKFQQNKGQSNSSSSSISSSVTTATASAISAPISEPVVTSDHQQDNPTSTIPTATLQLEYTPPISTSADQTHHHVSPYTLDTTVMTNGSLTTTDHQSMKDTISVLISERAELKLQNERLLNELGATMANHPQQTSNSQETGLLRMQLEEAEQRENSLKTRLNEIENRAKEWKDTGLLRMQVEEAKQRENSLKTRLNEIEIRAKEWKDSSDKLVLERRDLMARIASQDQVISGLKSEIQEHKINSNINSSDSSDKDELERTRKILEEKQDMIESLSISLADAKRKHTELQSNLESSTSQYTSQLQSERQARATIEPQLANLTNQLGTQSQTISILTSKNQTLSDSLKETEFSKSSMSQRISELSVTLEKQRGEVEKAGRQTDALNASTERSQKLLNENKMLIAQLAELRERIVELTNEKALLLDELETEKRKVNTLQFQLSSVTLDGVSSPDPVADSEMVQRLQADITRYEVELKRLQSLIDANHNRANDTTNHTPTTVPDTINVANLRQTLMRTREELEASRRENATLRYQLRDLRETDSGVDSDEERLSSAQNHSAANPSSPVVMANIPTVIITATTEQQTDPIDVVPSTFSGGNVNDGAKGLTSALSGDPNQQQHLIQQYEKQFHTQQQKLVTLYNDSEGLRHNVAALDKRCRAAETALVEERRINTLLSAEVDVVQDYISLYHQERKALQEQMDRLVSRMQRNSPEMAEALRESATLPPTPARFKTAMERKSSAEINDGAPPSYDGHGTSSPTRRHIQQPVLVDSQQDRRGKGSGIHGMLLRGVVLSHGPCPKCSSYVLDL